MTDSEKLDLLLRKVTGLDEKVTGLDEKVTLTTVFYLYLSFVSNNMS